LGGSSVLGLIASAMARSPRPPTRGGRHAAHWSLAALLCATTLLLRTRRPEAFVGSQLGHQNRAPWFAGGSVQPMLPHRLPRVSCANTENSAPAANSLAEPRKMTAKQWIRYMTSLHGVTGVLSLLGGSIWTTVRLAMGSREASHSEVVVNVVLSAVILITGISRLKTVRNPDITLKFWVGISIQIFALVQILEAPLLGWIPHSIFGNWTSRIWGAISVYFYVKWLMQIKKWNTAYETKNDKTVARIYNPLMAPAMGSVVVMEIFTFVNFVELHFSLVSQCSAARMLFMDSQLVSLAVNNVAQFTLTLASQKKVKEITPLFYGLGVFGAVQFGLLMWVHLKHLGLPGLNAITLIPLICKGA